MDLEHSRQHWIECFDKLIWEEPAYRLLQQEEELRARLGADGLRLRDLLEGLPSDESLAIAIQKGFMRNEAFEELVVNRYQKLLLLWNFRWHADADLARDLLQQLFCRLLRNRLSSFQPHRNFRAYLYRTAWNLYVDHLRQPRPGRSLQSIPEPLTTAPQEDEMVGRELADRVEQAVGRLAEPGQSVLRLTMNGHTSDEIAGQLGLSKRAVFARLFAARRWLERELHLPSHKRRYSET